MTLVRETLYIRFLRQTAKANALDDNATLAYNATKYRRLATHVVTLFTRVRTGETDISIGNDAYKAYNNDDGRTSRFEESTHHI